MQIINAIQGSPEWHAHRAQSLNASDAPAMMGCSPYKTRAQLVREMATGVTPEVDPATQRRFEDGHRFEALARPLAEQIIGEELFPVVGFVDGPGGRRLSASFDGLTMMEDVAYEHKTLNADLREVMQDGSDGSALPLHYRAQMEQQLAVSGAERVLFVASAWRWDSDAEAYLLTEMRHCWYTGDPALRKQIMDGWAQLLQDVSAYQSGNEQPAMVLEQARTPENLPALLIEVSGSVTRSNLEPFKAHALAVIAEIKTDLQDDQDFADAEATVKWLKADVAEQLKAAKAHAQAQMHDVDVLFRAIDDIVAAADSKRLQLEKLVKVRKDEIRASIISAAQQALDAHVAELNKRMPQPWLNRIMGAFIDVIRGKRSLTSMQDAIDGELARCRIEANELAGRLQDNAKALIGDDGRDWMFLFADFATVGLKPAEDFAAIAAQRIAQHKAAEVERQRAETEAKARADAALQAAATAVPAPAATPAPVAQSPQATAAPSKPVADDGGRIKLGEIQARIAPLSITAAGLAQLGFAHVGAEGASKLYRACDFAAICAAMENHLRGVREEIAA